MRFSLKSAGVRWLGSAVILGTAAISASVAVKIESFTGLMEKLLVRMMSAPQTLGTASTSINASRSMRSPGVHVPVVVVQVEAVEIDALPALDLLDAQHLSAQELQGLARAGLEHRRIEEIACAHLRGSAGSPSTEGGRGCRAAYSRSARRMSAARSGAAPRATVRSSNSSCCWLI